MHKMQQKNNSEDEKEKWHLSINTSEAYPFLKLI